MIPRSWGLVLRPLRGRPSNGLNEASQMDLIEVNEALLQALSCARELEIPMDLLNVERRSHRDRSSSGCEWNADHDPSLYELETPKETLWPGLRMHRRGSGMTRTDCGKLFMTPGGRPRWMQVCLWILLDLRRTFCPRGLSSQQRLASSVLIRSVVASLIMATSQTQSIELKLLGSKDRS